MAFEKGLSTSTNLDTGGSATITRFPKNGDTIIAGMHSLEDGMFQNVVSVYDNQAQQSVILPVVVKDYNNSLYKKAVEELWNMWNEDVAKTHRKSDSAERIRSMINSGIQQQGMVYIGMTDCDTGDPFILQLNYTNDQNASPKGGNVLLDQLKDLEEELNEQPVQIKRGTMTTWNVKAVNLKKLTPNQLENFNNRKEVPAEEFEKCLYLSTPENEKLNIQKFNKHFGVNLLGLGVPETEPQPTSNEPKFV